MFRNPTRGMYVFSHISLRYFAPLIRRNLFTNKPFFVYFRKLTLSSCIFTTILNVFTFNPKREKASESTRKSRLELFLATFSSRACHDVYRAKKNDKNGESRGRELAIFARREIFALSYENDPKRAAPRTPLGLATPAEGRSRWPFREKPARKSLGIYLEFIRNNFERTTRIVDF